MAALLQQWEQLRQLPTPGREALPAPRDYTDAEIMPLPDIRTRGRTPRADIFNRLDTLNQRDVEGDTDEGD